MTSELLLRSRQQLAEIFQAGVLAADPFLAVKTALLAENNILQQGAWTKIHLIAFGKAAVSMAKAAQDCIPPLLLANQGLVVTTYGNVRPITNCIVLGAGHPLPDEAGLQAAQRVAERLKSVRVGELILVLISGGGSALLPLPVEGISLVEKINCTQLLLASGATINEMNCVRKHLSQLKGGGMAQLAAEVDLHALILSDVLGDEVSVIASGPTVADETSYADAINILQTYHVWARLPAVVQNHLLRGAEKQIPETPKTTASCFKNKAYTLVGSNALSVAAALQNAQLHSYHTELYSQHLWGEARLAAENLANYAKQRQTAGLDQVLVLIAGGETTVSLGVSCGKGGRNQELALAFALAAEHHELQGDWVFLSAGTDGQDGPTDAAGGLVDSGTLQRIRQAGLEPAAALNRHDAYPVLQAANDLFITGATGTNVADLQILLLNPIHEK
jgi:hydroxypyruvate reductase